MNYVDYSNVLGLTSKEIPCITGTGAPTTATEGAVGCLYMDTDNGDVYKCIKVEDGVYTWEDIGGIINAKEIVVGLNNIPTYDKYGNSTTVLDDVYSGVIKVYVKLRSDNPEDLDFSFPSEGYLLMEQRIGGYEKSIIQTILKDNVIYTRTFGIYDITGEYIDDPEYNFASWFPFLDINLFPISFFDSDSKNTPLSAYAGKVLNEQKEDISNKSTTIDDSADNTKYPTTKAVKDYVDTSAEPNTIVNTAEGSAINITDSANAKLKGLKIFGKTTQEGEPSVENPQPLVSVGDGGSITTKVYEKNLLDISVNPVLVKQEDGSYVNKNDKIGITTFPLNLPYGSYTFSCDIKCPVGKNARIKINLKDGTHIEDFKNSTNEFVHFEKQFIGAPKSWSFDYSANCAIGELVIKNAQLETGSVVTEYEPFKEPQVFTLNTPNGLPGVPVTSGGNYTDENGQQWICDEIDLARNKYIQRIGMLEITKADYYDAPTNAVPYATIYAADRKEGNTHPLLCTHYKFNGYDITSGHIYTQKDRNGIVIRDSRFIDRATANAILETEKPKVIYELAEPIETDLNLTDEEIAQYKALTTHKPVTNVFNDADAYTKVDYVADTKNYIDNKFAEMQAAIISMGGNI